MYVLFIKIIILKTWQFYINRWLKSVSTVLKFLVLEVIY